MVINMNLRQKVGHLLAIEIPGTRLTPETAAFIEECHPAGVILFGRNLSGPWETARLIDDLQSLAAQVGDAPLLMGIDQEGGNVSHLRYPCVEMPGAMARAAGGPSAPGEAALALGLEMARLGFNLALAPVLDVNTNPLNPVIGVRAFSDDPATVAACGVATVEALRQAGMLSLAKHFPGHGATSTDSHLALPTVKRSRSQLWEVELVPFRAAIEAGVEALCSAHVVYPALDASGLPATLSRPIMTDLLRGELGFKGVLFSDALVMEAVSQGQDARVPVVAIQAVQAGVDCLMVLGSLQSQRRCYDALVAAVETGLISEDRLDEAVARVAALRQRVKLPQPQVQPAWPDNAHQNLARQLARQAVTLLRDAPPMLPLVPDYEEWGVVEFASGSVSPVEGSRNEPLGASILALLLGGRLPQMRFLVLHGQTPGATETLAAFLAGCTRVLVASRNAIYDPAQAELLGQVAAAGLPTVHLALRSPYDATIYEQPGTVLLTFGDQSQSIAAVVDVLLGVHPATGQLPLKLDLKKAERTNIEVSS